MSHWLVPVAAVCGLLANFGLESASEAADAEPVSRLTVPEATAYVEPDPGALRVSEEGLDRWTDSEQRVVWFGWLDKAGTLELAVDGELGDGEQSKFQLAVSPVAALKEDSSKPSVLAALTATLAGTAGKSVSASFGTVTIRRAGYHRFELSGVERSGKSFGRIRALNLTGEAVSGAQFNLKPRRNCASVHLFYPAPKETEVAVFYNELTVETEPLWSYYMACGFHRGYFGIQVNSPTERRVIFSVWDSGNEAIDRNKVNPDDRVQLLANGPDVVAHGFGNEGTGGHSHLVYDWKGGQTYRFAVTAEPDKAHTVFAGYFWFPETEKWGLIAKFRAPKDGGYLRGLYSFDENFGGQNGQLLRRAAFGNQWIRTPAGDWRELLDAKFSHDGTGREDRLDYWTGVENGRFVLATGGFLGRGTKYGQTMSRSASGQPHPVFDVANGRE